MKKNIYEILNEVDVDMNNYNKEEFNDIEKRKIYNNFKKSIKKKRSYKKIASLAATAVVSISLLGTSLGTNVYAGIHSFFYDISNMLNIEKNLDDYKTVVNKSVTKNGLTLQLNEVILDNDELIVSSTTTYDKGFEESGVIWGCNIYINGKRVNNGSGGSAAKIDENTIQEVIASTIKGEYNGNLDIKIVYSNPLINGKTIKGKWEFAFTTNGDELRLDTKEIELDTSFILENGQKVTLYKFTSNNLGQKIYSKTDTKGTEYDLILKGQDNLGNEISFYLSSTEDYDGLFKVENLLYKSLDENATSITLTPYAVKFPEKSGKMSNDYKQTGAEFTINLK